MSDSAPQSRLQPPLPPPTNPPAQPRTTTRPAAPPASAATWTRSSAASRRCSSRTKSRSLRRRTGAHISAESRPMSAISRLSLTRPAAPQAKQPRRHPPWRRAHDVVQGPPRSPPARPAPPRVGGRPRLSPSGSVFLLPTVSDEEAAAHYPGYHTCDVPSKKESPPPPPRKPPRGRATRTPRPSPPPGVPPPRHRGAGQDRANQLGMAATRTTRAARHQPGQRQPWNQRAGGDVLQFCRDLQMDARVLF